MKHPDDNFNEARPNSRFGLDLRDVEAIRLAIQELDESWKKPQKSLQLSQIDWTPSLIASDGRVCHIHAVSQLGGHWIDRMKRAQIANRKLVIAAPLTCWQVDATLIAADELGAQPILLSEDDGWNAKTYRSVAQLIGHEKFLLNPEALTLLGGRLLERSRRAINPNLRGSLFEDFLAFLFSQIIDFELFAQNYNTSSQEIDLVLKNRRTDGRALPNSPIVLVSAKNKSTPVGASAVTTLESKMQLRRGMCHLGFLCSSGLISRDAYRHELNHSLGQNVVVLLDGKGLDSLIQNAKHINRDVEQLVIKACLR